MGFSPFEWGLFFAIVGVSAGYPLIASMRAEIRRFFGTSSRETWYTNYYTKWVGGVIFTVHAILFGLGGFYFLKDEDGGAKYTAVGWLQVAATVLLTCWMPTLFGIYHRGAKSETSTMRTWIALVISTLHTGCLVAIACIITFSDGLDSRTTPIVLFWISVGLSLLEWVWNILLIAGGDAKETYNRLQKKIGKL
jgi:hypothetical protein